MFQELAESQGNVIGYKAIGKLTDDDYKEMVPKLDQLIEEKGNIRMLLQLEDFHGWEMEAAWDDLKFGLKHRNDIERLAVVGDRQWEKLMADLVKPFMSGQVQYFETPELRKAWEWLRQDNV
jgi:hypothetical protein